MLSYCFRSLSSAQFSKWCLMTIFPPKPAGYLSDCLHLILFVLKSTAIMNFKFTQNRIFYIPLCSKVSVSYIIWKVHEYLKLHDATTTSLYANKFSLQFFLACLSEDFSFQNFIYIFLVNISGEFLHLWNATRSTRVPMRLAECRWILNTILNYFHATTDTFSTCCI